jgi:DNA recombination protein RmuC
MDVTTLIMACAIAAMTFLAAGLLIGRRHATPGRTPDLEAVESALDRLGQRLNEAEALRRSDQSGMRSEIAEQLRHVEATTQILRRETGQLAAALGRADVRGRWGEAQLRRLVEAAGLLDRVHFVEQDSRSGHDGGQRPDMVIDLAAGRSIVVDAKVPLTALLEAEACDDPAARAELFTRHARDVAAHADRLGAKDYWRQYDDSVDVVVMFLPAESILGIALREDPALLDRAFSRNVILATPTTFLALMRTVSHVWRQEAIADNAREIHRLGRELHDRLGRFAEHMRRVGTSIDSAVSHYNKMVGSFDGRVMVTARRLSDHGLGDGALPEVVPITQRSRESAAADVSLTPSIGPDPERAHLS